MVTIHVDIVSAEGEIHSGKATMVFAPAKMGEVGIAPRHAPLLTALKPGEVRVQTEEGDEETFYITGGMLEVQPHSVTVLADTALRGDQLDEAAALAAQQEAEQALEGASEETDIARAQQELAEARARYRAAQKLKGELTRLGAHALQAGEGELLVARAVLADDRLAPEAVDVDQERGVDLVRVVLLQRHRGGSAGERPVRGRRHPGLGREGGRRGESEQERGERSGAGA